MMARIALRGLGENLRKAKLFPCAALKVFRGKKGDKGAVGHFESKIVSFRQNSHKIVNFN